MGRRLLIAVVAVVVVALAGWQFATRMFMAAPGGLDLSLSKKSENGLYAVTLTPEEAPVKQGPLQSFVLTVKMPDGQPAEISRIEVGGGMPKHGHGLPTEPRVTKALGDGKYRIEGFKFTMSGWWRLTFTIDAPPGRDEADFNIVL